MTDIIGVKHVDELEGQNPLPEKVAFIETNWLRFLMGNPITRPVGKIFLNRSIKLKRKTERFPSFIQKTDETRIQTMPQMLSDSTLFVCREKLDGSSMTVFIVKKKRLLPWLKPRIEYGVCSRNRRLVVGGSDSARYLDMFEKHDFRTMLREISANFEWAAIQGELIGPGIQKNPYKLTENDFYAFNLIIPNGRIPCTVAETIVKGYGIKWCPLAGTISGPMTVDEILNYATAPSAINPDVLREGIVCRNYARRISFKAVSPEYLVRQEAS